jgi:hypothetical protein
LNILAIISYREQGANFIDYDLNGYPDIFHSNDSWFYIEDSLTTFHAGAPNSIDHISYDVEGLPDNNGARRRMFLDVTDNMNVAGNACSWSCAFADYDNDGDLDLYVANWTMKNIENDPVDLEEPNHLYNNSSRKLISGNGTGGAPNGADNLMSWPDTNVNNALRLKLIGGDEDGYGNKSAVGAYIFVKVDLNGNDMIERDIHFFTDENKIAWAPVRTDSYDRGLGEVITRYIQAGNGSWGQEPLTQHIGLDTAQSIKELIIKWPNNPAPASQNRHIFYDLPVPNNGLLELTIKEDEQPALYYSDINTIDYRQVRIGSQSLNAWVDLDDEYSSAVICIKNTASESFLTTVPLTVRLDTQNPQFKLSIDETLPFSQTLSVSLDNNEYVDVFIQFTPQSEGLITSTIELISNDPDDEYEPFEAILLTGMGVPDTDGDSYMDYNDDENLDDPDADNDGLSDSLEGGDDPDESSSFRSIDSDGNSISDALESIDNVKNRCLNVNFQPLLLGVDEIKAPTGFLKDIGEEFTTPTEQVFGWWDDIDMTPYTGCSVTQIDDLYNTISQTYIDVPSTFSVSVVWKADFSDIPGKYRFIAIVEDTKDEGETSGDFLVKITDVKASGYIRNALTQGEALEGELKTINTTIFLDSETDFFELHLAPGTRIYYLQFIPIVTASINFQPDPAGDPPCLIPAGFLADYGVGYLEESGYGWFDNADFDTSYTLDSGHFVRTDPDGYTNQITNTYVEFPCSGVNTGYWGMRLPVGTYRVIATVGDTANERGPHSVLLEDDGLTSDIFNGEYTGSYYDEPSTKTKENTYVVLDSGDGYVTSGVGLSFFYTFFMSRCVGGWSAFFQ